MKISSIRLCNSAPSRETNGSYGSCYFSVRFRMDFSVNEPVYENYEFCCPSFLGVSDLVDLLSLRRPFSVGLSPTRTSSAWLCFVDRLFLSTKARSFQISRPWYLSAFIVSMMEQVCICHVNVSYSRPHEYLIQ